MAKTVPFLVVFRYLALRHAQIPVDIVNEEDCIRGSLNHYGLLFVVDPQVSETAVAAIGAWVSTGGRVYMTAGGAQLNEANQTNAAVAAISGGVKTEGIWTGTRYSRHNASIYLIKQELPFAEMLDEVSVLATETTDAATLGVYGDKSVFTFTAPAGKIKGKDYNISGLFADASPAIITTAFGKGTATYAGLHLGLAYMQPALPRRPVDRTPDLDGFTHFTPTAFNTGARELLINAAAGIAGAIAPVNCSNPLVEVRFTLDARVAPLPPLQSRPSRSLSVDGFTCPDVSQRVSSEFTPPALCRWATSLPLSARCCRWSTGTLRTTRAPSTHARTTLA